MSVVLEAREITKRFGGLTAVDAVDLAVPEGQVHAIIGPNGAGKTTLFDCLTGHQRPDAGRVWLNGRDITGLVPDQRARIGLARTFQRLEVFGSMTVADNLRVAAEAALGSPWSDLLRWRPERLRSVDAAVDRALAATDLGARADDPVAGLATGTLRLVELARALCTDPAAVLLDEPASGLDQGEVRVLRRVLGQLAGRGVAIVLVEHDLALVLDVCHRVSVLDGGRIIASGPPADVQANPAVRTAYLGADA